MADPEMREFMTRGDIIQIDPDLATNIGFGACLAVVDEIKAWGVQAYVQALGTRSERGGQAFIRLNWPDFELTGGAVAWSHEGADEQ
jgi:hypothetical protein